MKIMHQQEPWPGKVNFIDEDGVYLGYDTEDACCAQGGWALTDEPNVTDEILLKYPMASMELEGWKFDLAYFKDHEDLGLDVQEGGAAQFKIVHGNAEKYITLFNNHNGYYGKGFTFTVPVDPGKSRADTL